MFSPRIALVGALSSAAAVALATVLAMPASASPTNNCFDAQTQLTSDQHLLDQARQADALEDSSVSGSTDFTPDAADQAVTNAAAKVSIDRGYVSALCSTPTTTPAPGPVGTPTPSFANCAAAFAAGVSNIPSTDPRYRLILDRDRDGIACERNGNDGGIPVGLPAPSPNPVIIYKVINGHKCKQVGNTWVPVDGVVPSQTVTYQVIDGVECKQVNGIWVPVDQTPVAAPPPVIYQAPQTVVAPAPVFTAPAPVYAAPIVPSGPAATGR